MRTTTITLDQFLATRQAQRAHQCPKCTLCGEVPSKVLRQVNAALDAGHPVSGIGEWLSTLPVQYPVGPAAWVHRVDRHRLIHGFHLR